MTAERRLAKLDASLTPTQLVLLWLGEAHAHRSFVAYSESLLDSELDDVPINRLCREARRNVLASLRTRSRDEEAKAVAKALRETLFRYFLVVRINVVAHDVLEKELYIHAAMAAFVGMLVYARANERDDDYRQNLASACSVRLARASELEATGQARTLAEERYLEGRPSLFPDVAAAWDEQVHQTRQATAMTLRLAELDSVDFPLSEDEDAASARVGARLADLVEPAKATALEKLGEGEHGWRIATDWLRSKLDASDDEDQFHAREAATL